MAGAGPVQSAEPNHKQGIAKNLAFCGCFGSSAHNQNLPLRPQSAPAKRSESKSASVDVDEGWRIGSQVPEPNTPHMPVSNPATPMVDSSMHKGGGLSQSLNTFTRYPSGLSVQPARFTDSPKLIPPGAAVSHKAAQGSQSSAAVDSVPTVAALTDPISNQQQSASSQKQQSFSQPVTAETSVPDLQQALEGLYSQPTGAGLGGMTAAQQSAAALTKWGMTPSPELQRQLQHEQLQQQLLQQRRQQMQSGQTVTSTAGAIVGAAGIRSHPATMETRDMTCDVASQRQAEDTAGESARVNFVYSTDIDSAERGVEQPASSRDAPEITARMMSDAFAMGDTELTLEQPYRDRAAPSRLGHNNGSVDDAGPTLEQPDGDSQAHTVAPEIVRGRVVRATENWHRQLSQLETNQQAVQLSNDLLLLQGHNQNERLAVPLLRLAGAVQAAMTWQHKVGQYSAENSAQSHHHGSVSKQSSKHSIRASQADRAHSGQVERAVHEMEAQLRATRQDALQLATAVVRLEKEKAVLQSQASGQQLKNSDAEVKQQVLHGQPKPASVTSTSQAGGAVVSGNRSVVCDSRADADTDRAQRQASQNVEAWLHTEASGLTDAAGHKGIAADAGADGQGLQGKQESTASVPSSHQQSISHALEPAAENTSATFPPQMSNQADAPVGRLSQAGLSPRAASSTPSSRGFQHSANTKKPWGSSTTFGGGSSAAGSGGNAVQGGSSNGRGRAASRQPVDRSTPKRGISQSSVRLHMGHSGSSFTDGSFGSKQESSRSEGASPRQPSPRQPSPRQPSTKQPAPRSPSFMDSTKSSQAHQHGPLSQEMTSHAEQEEVRQPPFRPSGVHLALGEASEAEPAVGDTSEHAQHGDLTQSHGSAHFTHSSSFMDSTQSSRAHHADEANSQHAQHEDSRHSQAAPHLMERAWSQHEQPGPGSDTPAALHMPDSKIMQARHDNIQSTAGTYDGQINSFSDRASPGSEDESHVNHSVAQIQSPDDETRVRSLDRSASPSEPTHRGFNSAKRPSFMRATASSSAHTIPSSSQLLNKSLSSSAI